MNHSMVSRRILLGGIAALITPLPRALAQNTAQEKKPEADTFRTIETRALNRRIVSEPAGETAVFGYDGLLPGPLLRVKQNDELRVRLVNKLAQPTSLHWQGLRGENAVDGVAGLTQKAIGPNETQDIRFKAADSGFFLYRPACAPYIGEQIARGLTGALIVDEPQPPDVDRDMLVLLSDWQLDEKGALAPFAAPVPGPGRVGTLLTANATPAPVRETLVPGARVRLRIANISAARILNLVFDGARPLVLAIDAQPCDAFEPVRRTIPVAPGARFDVMLDLPTQEGGLVKLAMREGLEGPLRDLFVLEAKGARVKERPAIVSLAPNTRLPPEIRLGEAKKIQLALEPPKAGAKLWSLNGEARGYAAKPLFSVKRGQPVSISFANKGPSALNMHVHGHTMRLLHDLDDGWEPYWRNAVIVAPARTKLAAFLADTPGKWAIRSDITDQEAAGIATWFEVT